LNADDCRYDRNALMQDLNTAGIDVPEGFVGDNFDAAGRIVNLVGYRAVADNARHWLLPVTAEQSAVVAIAAAKAGWKASGCMNHHPTPKGD
jgi:hypothetical protein